MPTDTSMNFTRYVHARHLPSAIYGHTRKKNKPTRLQTLATSFNQLFSAMGIHEGVDRPCVETALERARSILLAAKMTARLRSKSMSCSIVSICSARVKEDLSTTENTIRNASALSSSSCRNKLNGKN